MRTPLQGSSRRPGVLRLAGAALSVAALGLGLAGCGTNKTESSSGGSGATGGASDTLTMALSFTSNYDPDVFFDLEEMYSAYAMFNAAKDSGTVVVAGHDPLVMDLFPATTGAEGLAVTLS